MRGSQLIEHVNTRKHQGTCRPPHQGNRACEHLSTDCNCPSLGNRACEHLCFTCDRVAPSHTPQELRARGHRDNPRRTHRHCSTHGLSIHGHGCHHQQKSPRCPSPQTFSDASDFSDTATISPDFSDSSPDQAEV